MDRDFLGGVVTICEKCAELKEGSLSNGFMWSKWSRCRRFQPRRGRQLVEQFRLKGAPVFTFIGSFYRYEGLRFLIDAVPRLIEKVPGAKVILVGGGYEESLMREKARLYGNTGILRVRSSRDAELLPGYRRLPRAYA
jgi:glycosyltransferase involved in cell wall biosynthesis